VRRRTEGDLGKLRDEFMYQKSVSWLRASEKERFIGSQGMQEKTRLRSDEDAMRWGWGEGPGDLGK